MGQERRITIGRLRTCDVVIADPSVSRQHAALVLRADGSLLIEDARSRAGTWIVAGGAVRRIDGAEPVRRHTRLRLGEVELTVDDLLAPPASPAGEPPRSSPPAARPERPTLVRCRCGAVKPTGTACPECGR